MDEKRLWHETLRERREECGVSQGRLALAAGISREYLNKIENGKKEPSDQLRKMIDKALALHNADSAIEILIDYVKVRFPTQDTESIMEKILGMLPRLFLRDGAGPLGYNNLYRHGDILVMTSDDPLKGAIVELKGKGCRQAESILGAQGRSWYDFLADCLWGGYVQTLRYCD